MRILVLEDDHKVATFIQRGLEEEGYAVDVLYDGLQAGVQTQSIDYDAAVLDLMPPAPSGLQVLRDIRAKKRELPVVVLSARDTLEDRVAGLDAGADDYMAKPFALAELSARLRALLRRGRPHENVLRVADLELDIVRRIVSRGGRRIDLRAKEYALLEFLMRHSGRPVGRLCDGPIALLIVLGEPDRGQIVGKRVRVGLSERRHPLAELVSLRGDRLPPVPALA